LRHLHYTTPASEWQVACPMVAPGCSGVCAAGQKKTAAPISSRAMPSYSCISLTTDLNSAVSRSAYHSTGTSITQCVQFDSQAGRFPIREEHIPIRERHTAARQAR